MREHRDARGRIAAAALAVALLAPVATAAGAPGETMKTTRFSITVQGTQTTDWTLDTTTHDGCTGGDLHSTGSGTERIAFRSERPVPIDVLKIGADVAVSAGAGGLPVSGTVQQQGTFAVDQIGGGESFCGGTEHPEGPQPYDCGTRSWRGTVQPVVHAPADFPVEASPDAPLWEMIVPLAPVLVLTGPYPEGDGTLQDLFANCPGAGGQLVPTPDSLFEAKRVFSKARRLVIEGTATTDTLEQGYRTASTIEWRAVLKRRRAVRSVAGSSVGRRGQDVALVAARARIPGVGRPAVDPAVAR